MVDRVKGLFICCTTVVFSRAPLFHFVFAASGYNIRLSPSVCLLVYLTRSVFVSSFVYLYVCVFSDLSLYISVYLSVSTLVPPFVAPSLSPSHVYRRCLLHPSPHPPPRASFQLRLRAYAE